MAKIELALFYPERVVWIGSGLLVGSALLGGLLIAFLGFFETIEMPSAEKAISWEERAPCNFSLGLSKQDLILPEIDLKNEMSFFWEPPKFNGSGKSRLLVRLRKGDGFKRVILPCRIDLEYQGERLRFSSETSPFWIELQEKEGKIAGQGYVSLKGEVAALGDFLAAAQESPIQSALELAPESPFRILAEAKSLGRDLLSESAVERLEIGAGGDIVEIKPNEWLVWRGGRWLPATAEEGLPLARVLEKTSKGLIMEGWEGEAYIRVLVNQAPVCHLKIKPEELLSSIRIRSEKQTSCMLEKQSFVIKAGDWILKTGGKWKVLRKKEERQSFLNHQLTGELLVFDGIVSKEGSKKFQGRLFNVGRTQMIPIEIAAVQSGRKSSARKKGAPR